MAKTVENEHYYIMTLEEFADEFLSIPVGQLRVLESRNSGDRLSLIMLRKPPFQAELILWGPGKIVPAHCHPNIDAVGYHVNGDMTMIAGATEADTNEKLRRAKIWPAKACKRPFRSRPGEWHGGKTGFTGCSFWSLQHWVNGVEMTAASRDWVGPELVTPEFIKLCA